MDVPTIQMDKEEARTKWQQYSQQIKNGYPDTAEGKRQHEIDLASAAGFAALADGLRVINVHSAIDHAGLLQGGTYAGLPRLAIARADATHVAYSFSSSTATFEGRWGDGWRSKRKRVTFSYKNLSWNDNFARSPFANARYSYRAIVPSIPPNVRPKYVHLATHVILWEASWERAPVDPYLLRPLRGDLFVVVAEWDLTELERGILEHAALR